MSDFDLSSAVPDPVRNAYLDERALGVSDTDSPDRQRWAYSHLMERSFGIKDFDGRKINNMQPIDDPWQALSRVREAIAKSSFEPLVDDDYKALMAAKTFGDRLKLARERTGRWKRSIEPAIKDAVKDATGAALSLDELSLLGDGDIDPLDAKKLRFYHEKLIPRIRELATRQNSIDQDSGAVYDDLSPEEHDALGILRESAEEIAAISDKYRPIVRDKSLVREFERKVGERNAWMLVAAAKQLGEDLRPVISEAGRTVLEYAETHDGDLGEYDKLFLGLDPDERGMLSPIIHMLKPNRDDAWLLNDAARAFWDQAKGIPVNALRAVEGAVVRSVVDGESYQMLREAEADLRLANQDKMKEWGVFGDAVIGVVGTLPYMGYALVPYAGVGAIAADASQRFEDQVAEQGGDVAGMDFFMAKYAFGAAYAAVEKAQTKLLTRKLAPGVARQAHLDMFHSIHAALKTGGLAAGNFAYETWEEGLQGGLEKGFVAWGLDKDVTSEVVAGIVTEMKDSAGTMGLLSLAGVAGNRVRYRRGAFENGADALASLSRLKDLQTKIAGNPEGREMKDFGAEYGYFARQWLNNGRKGLLDMGLTPMMAESMSKSFQGVWNSVKDDDVARMRFADGGRVLTMAEYASKAMPWLEVKTNDDGTLHFRRKADAPAGSPDVDIDLEVVPGGIKLDYADQEVVALIVASYNRGRPVEEQTTVERFNALGEAEKDAFVEANNVGIEGYYTATAPSGARVDSVQLEALELVDEEGRSLGDAEEDGLTLEEITARGYHAVRRSADGKSQRVTLTPAKKATRMSGRIVMSGKRAPSAQFHELFHAVSRFLVDSGQLDAGAVEGMRALFGDPRRDDEAFNEEVAAEAYRGFLQGKVNMVEDGMLRKFADAVGQALKLMRLVHDKRREDMAEWEQVFSDVQSGNFSGIPVAANSAAKKLAAARAADESRKKAREESDAKHKKPDAAPDAAPAAPAASGDGSGTGGAEDARKAAAARFGVPAPASAPGGQTNAPDSQAPLSVGEWRADTPDGEMKVGGYWAVMDAGDLVTSDDERYDQRIQPRNRDAMASALQVLGIAKRLNPARLFDSATTDGGSPIVMPNGMVVTGNGRVMALRKAMEIGTFPGYAQAVREQAAALGIEIDPRIKNPVLVRAVTTQMDDATLQDFARRSNKPGVLSMNPAENAEADAKAMLDSKIIDLLDTDEEGNLRVASNRSFMEAFITLTGDQGLRMSDGSISPEAYSRARRAILAAILVEAPNARDLITEIVEADPADGIGFAGAVDGVTRAGAALVKLIASNPEYSISLDLAQALGDFVSFNRRKRAGVVKDIESFLRELDAFGARSGIAESLIREFATRPNPSAKSVADMLLHYARNAALQDNSSPALFAMEVLSREDILDNAISATLDPEEAAKRPKTKRGIVNAVVIPAKSSATPPAAPGKTPAKPVRPDRDPLPRKSAGALEEIDMLRLRSEAMLEGVVRGYRMSQAEIEADPVLSAIKHRVETTVVDGLSGELGRKPQAIKNWFLERIPCFQGSKREMGPFVATAILRMNRAQRENFSKAVGWFSGTGTFEMSMAVLKLANGEYMLPNVKEIELHEYDAGRVEQTRFFWEHGNEVEDYIASTKVADIWAAAVDQEMARIVKLRQNMLMDNAETRRTEERMTFAKVAAVFAQWDAKTTAEKALKAQILERAMSDRQSNGPSKKAPPKGVNAVAADASAEAGVDIDFDPDTEDSDEVAMSEGKELMPNEDRVLWFKRRFFSTYVETIKNNAEATWRVYDEFTRVKGGKVSIVEGDSYQAEVSRGDDVLSFVDPPYVDTLGYSSWRRVEKDGKVSFELVKPESNGVDLYEQTAGILERLSNAGHGLVYTDESFTFAKVNKNGTIKRPKVLAGALPVYMRLQKNFDEIGSVKKLIGAGRMETIGVRAGGYDNASYRHSENEKLAEEGGRGDGVPGADSASGRAGGERIKPENVAGDGSGPRTGEGMVLAGLPNAVGDRDSTGVQGTGREAELGEVAGGDDAARGQPGRVEDIGLFAEHGSWGGGQAPGQGAVGRGGGGDTDVGAAEADAGGARSESDAAQRRYSIVADRLFAAVTGGLQAQIDAVRGRDAKQSIVDAWKAENPERYAELEKMREAALKAAGYTSPRLFRGSVEDDGVELQESFEAGGGIFLTDSEDVAAIFTFPREFGESITSQYDEETGDDVDVEPGPIIQAYAKLENPLVLTRDTEVDSKDFVIDSGLQSKTIKQAKASGKDGIVVKDTKEGVGEWMEEGTTYVVFKSSQVKLTEPISLDASGMLIPPSQWADESKPDIRYSIVGDRGGESLGVTNDAEKMEADGIARETIWRETGWWRGPDRKWRFEVDEDFFRVRKSAFKQLGKRPIKLGTLLRDNPVFHAYPQIRDVKVVLDDGSNPIGSLGELDVENGTITLAKRLKRYDGDVSHTLSHEIQHLIQEYEGFAKGGNFSTVAFDWDSSKIDIQAENPALSWAMGVFIPMYRRLHPEPSEQVREDGERLANELGRDGVQDKVNGLVDRIYNERKMNAYLLLAGEVESRVVQDRLWMEKEERKSEPPWVTMERILREDKLLKEGQTPDDVLIVKGADGVQDTSRRHSLYSPYQSGRFGAGTILSAIIATDKVKGIERTDEAYQQLATALRTKTDVAKAKAEADAFLRRETKAASMDVSDIAQSMTQEKFPELVEKLFTKGSGYGVEVGARAQQGMIRAEKNAIADARGATLHDMVADTGVDIARILLSVYPEAFDPSLEERRAKAKENDADEAGAAAAGRGEFVGPPTEEQVASRSKLDAERKRKAAVLVAKLQAWRLQMAEAKAREERDAALRAKEDELNAEAAAEKSDDELDADDEADMQELIVPPEIIADSGVDLNDALEFAHFLRLWVESWLAGPGVDPGATLGDRINVAKFRKTMIAQLGDIASKWLDPKDGRTAVNIEKQIDAIPESADPDTIEKRTASIIATIQRAAIRQNRDRLVKEARESIAKLALSGKQLDEMEKDVKRKIKGDHEATARYVSEILSWGPQRIEREMVRLDNIVNDRDAAYAAAHAEHGKDVRMASDVQVHRALERRAALERWGGLKHKLPADILRGKAEIEAWLKTERLAHEAKWEGQKAKWDRLAEIVQKAATRDSRRAKPGKLGVMGRFADETSATIRQKLEAIMQGGGAEAAEAIALIEDMFNEGSQKLGVYRAKYRMQIEDAFKFAVQGQDMTQRQLIELLDEQIPAELNARISSGDQGALDMTWKQAAQLYSYLLQTASYKDNIAKWGRDGQRELLREAMPVPVVRLVAKLQDIYQQRREELSALVEEVTGFPVYNPDPLYMPVKMFLGAREGLDTQVHGWSPLAKSLTPRKVHGRDCDEHADIITMYNESTESAVRALAFGSTGIAIRSILARQATADAIARHHGDEALRALRSQITDTLNDGWRESGGGLMLGLVRKASNFTTYSSLSYNFQSGLVQFAASPAWIEVLEGGIGEMLRHIANFDMDSARELVAAPGFVSRYGNESFGQMIRESFADKRVHPILRVYKAGMTVVQFADFLASVLVGTGVYKAQKEANAKKGMAPDQAAAAAARTAWGLIEYAQQSSRVMNTPEFMRRHGLIARQLYKFQSGPLLQLSHETHAFRLLNRAAKGDERRQAWKHLLNVLVANHVMLPVAMTAVQTAFGALLGDEPDEEEVFGTLIVEMLLGPAASIIFVGAIMSRTVGGVVKATTGLKPRSYPGDGGMPAAQQLERLAKTGALLPSDIAALDFEGFRDDMATMLGQVFAPARYAKKAVYNATDYDPAAERRKRQRLRRR